MTPAQNMRMCLGVALTTLERSMDCTDAEQMREMALQAAARITETCESLPVTQAEICVRPGCGRKVIDHDPIFKGHCSTMCREGLLYRSAFQRQCVTAAQVDLR